MKYDIAMKWVEALRSGKYKQENQLLKYNNSFCCLGVLCDISELDDWSEFNSYLNERYFLSKKVMEWSGIKTSSGYIPNKDIYLSLLNDAGKSFNEIADIIEEHWEKL